MRISSILKTKIQWCLSAIGQIGRSSVAAYFATIMFVVVGFLVAYDRNIQIVGSIDFPPIHGGSDQVDYHIMAYTLAATGYVGKIHNAEMRKPFVEFSIKKSDRLSLKQKSLLDRYLIDLNEDQPSPYAYRPWAYSLVLGLAYRLFGYDFMVGRLVNIILFALIVGLTFLFAKSLGGWGAGLTAAALLLAVPRLAETTTQFLTEPIVALALLLFLVSAYYAHCHRFPTIATALIGIFAGAAVLAKQLMLPVMLILVVSVLILFRRHVHSSAVKTIGIVVIAFIITIAPWITYNIVVTGDSSLATGTSGWHDMPSSYDVRYLEGESRFQVREKIFQEYEAENKIAVKGNVQRAMVGREIFLARLGEADFWLRLPEFIVFKAAGELQAGLLEWTIRVLAVIGLLAIANLFLSALFGGTLFIFLMVIMGTFETGGRVFASAFPIVCVLASLGSLKLGDTLRNLITGQRQLDFINFWRT